LPGAVTLSGNAPENPELPSSIFVGFERGLHARTASRKLYGILCLPDFIADFVVRFTFKGYISRRE